jgi:phage anti-repressor protein
MSKRTGASLRQDINTASTATMLVVGLTKEQAERIIRVRRTLPLVPDSTTPSMDAAKLWDKIGKPGGRFRNWATAYIKPMHEDATFSAEISAVKIPARGTPRVDYRISRDVAAHLAMSARTPEGADVRRYFLDMEKLAALLGEHQPSRVTALVDLDNQLTHLMTKRVGDGVKAGRFTQAELKPIAMARERDLKRMICKVLTGEDTTYWRSTFGRGVRDVLNTNDLQRYINCMTAMLAYIKAGITKHGDLQDRLTEDFGGKLNPAKYSAALAQA